MRGFSLVELSIVLVILGLLTGGILTGQSLIRASELRAATTEFQRYQSAVNTFRDKYFAIPGDMRNAEDFWGSMTGGSGCPNAASGTGTQTCNGDGDGVINNGSLGGSVSHERFTFWQQLANAGLIEGTYTGIAGSGGQLDAVPAENVPSSKLGNGVWFADNQSTGNAITFNVDYGNHFLLGVDPGTGNNRPVSPLLVPEEAWNIDTKLDDGVATSGSIIALRVVDCTTSIDENDFTGDYDLSASGTLCVLTFRNAF